MQKQKLARHLQTWQDSVSTNGRDEPSVAEDAASRGSEEGPKQTIDELEEAMRVQAEEMEQLKLQLSMTTKLFEQCKQIRTRLRFGEKGRMQIRLLSKARNCSRTSDASSQVEEAKARSSMLSPK